MYSHFTDGRWLTYRHGLCYMHVTLCTWTCSDVEYTQRCVLCMCVCFIHPNVLAYGLLPSIHVRMLPFLITLFTYMYKFWWGEVWSYGLWCRHKLSLKPSPLVMCLVFCLEKVLMVFFKKCLPNKFVGRENELVMLMCTCTVYLLTWHVCRGLAAVYVNTCNSLNQIGNQEHICCR